LKKVKQLAFKLNVENRQAIFFIIFWVCFQKAESTFDRAPKENRLKSHFFIGWGGGFRMCPLEILCTIVSEFFSSVENSNFIRDYPPTKMSEEPFNMSQRATRKK